MTPAGLRGSRDCLGQARLHFQRDPQPSRNHNAWGPEMAEYDPVPQTAVTTKQDISASSQVAEAPSVQQQQRASDGFLSSGPRLEGYIPTPPHKRAKKSYIWQVGILGRH